jgi:hypothetical protein
MTEKKKPSMRAAICLTVVAMFWLLVELIDLVDGGAPAWRKMALLLSSTLAAVGAIIQWVVYFQQWVRFEIESHEERTKTKE